MTTKNNTLLRTVRLTAVTLALSLLWLAPQALAHGGGGSPCLLGNAVVINACYGSMISLSQGNRVSTAGQLFSVEFGKPLTLTVDPASSYTFSGNLVLLIEPTSGNFGLTKLSLCNDPATGFRIQGLSGGCSQFISSNKKSITVPITAPILNSATRTFVLTAWNGTRGASLHADGKSFLKFVPAGSIPNPKPKPKGTAPVITSVSVSATVPAGGSINGTINFTDPDGDVVRAELRAVSNFTAAAWNPNVFGQKAGQISFHINCKKAGDRFSTNAVLTDQAGHVSNALGMTFTCVNSKSQRKGTAPMITSVNINSSVPAGGSVNGTINFTDLDGDVSRADLRAVSNFTAANWNPNVVGRKVGQISFRINCKNIGDRFSTDVVLTDQAGHQSNAVRLDFVCVKQQNTTNSNVPVIVDISPQNATIQSNSKLRLSVTFSDLDGDIIRAEGRIIRTGRPFFSFDPRIDGRTSGRFFPTQNCNGQVGKFSYNLVVIDRQGHESQPKQFNFECVNNARTLGIKSAADVVANGIPAPLIDLDNEATTLSVQALQLNAQGAGGYMLSVQGQGVASVQLQVFNLSGDVVFDDTTSGNALRWQGLDVGGNTLSNGVYLYVVTVKGYDGKVVRSQVKKLMILH